MLRVGRRSGKLIIRTGIKTHLEPSSQRRAIGIVRVSGAKQHQRARRLPLHRLAGPDCRQPSLQDKGREVIHTLLDAPAALCSSSRLIGHQIFQMRRRDLTLFGFCTVRGFADLGALIGGGRRQGMLLTQRRY